MDPTREYTDELHPGRKRARVEDSAPHDTSFDLTPLEDTEELDGFQRGGLTRPSTSLDDPAVPEPRIVEEKAHYLQESHAHSTATFFVRTMNVLAFRDVLKSLVEVPNVTVLLMKFDEHGMTLYSCARTITTVGGAFWNRSMFETYVCPQKIEKWISVERFTDLKPKLTTGEVQFLDLRLLADHHMDGFEFSGEIKTNEGQRATFKHAAYAWIEPDGGVQRITTPYDLHLFTSAHTFETQVKLLSKSLERIRLRLDRSILSLSGIDDQGVVMESVEHNVETSITHTIQVDFQRKALKPILAGVGLAKNIRLSFYSASQRAPLLFVYELDHEQPQSHVSYYVLPLSS
jgi:hypothetical protein